MLAPSLGDDRGTWWPSFDSRTREQQTELLTGVIERASAASITLVTRLGFTHEGRLRDHVFTNGAWRDSILYSLLVHEWQACGPNPQEQR